MSDEKSLFERTDDLEQMANQHTEMLNEILGILHNQQPQRPTNTTNNGQSQQNAFRNFLMQAKKSWAWFGSKGQFLIAKKCAIFSIAIMLVIGLITTIVSIACFKMYSTFTFFENIWMIFGIIGLTYAINAERIYEVNQLASHSFTKYRRDEVGMMLPTKQKAAFTIFKWLAIISVPCNVICIWTLGHQLKVFSTIMELLFLASLIVARVLNFRLFDRYGIIFVDGKNPTGNRVVLVLPPGEKELMLEEDFKKKMAFFYE